MTAATIERKTSAWGVATEMPSVLFGRDATLGNLQIPLTLLQTFVEDINKTDPTSSGGEVLFRGTWDSTGETSYVSNNVIFYLGKVYLMIGSDALTSTTVPDSDTTNWLCLSGQAVTVTDCNTAPGGVMFYSAGAANTPDSDTYGYGMTILNNNSGIQLFWSTDGETMYVRSCSGGTWAAWVVLVAAFSRAQTPGVSSSSGTDTVYVNVENNGEFYTTVANPTVLEVSGWPASGKVARFRWEIVNGGAHTVTWGINTTYHWIKADGTTTTNFADLGITLNTAGSNFFELWSRDGGTTIYIRPLLG